MDIMLQLVFKRQVFVIEKMKKYKKIRKANAPQIAKINMIM